MKIIWLEFFIRFILSYFYVVCVLFIKIILFKINKLTLKYFLRIIID
ncbi:hypothetical protein Asch03_02180 [Acinetobacter schindleri]|uniref:Uncharacterized protein n=1 Tax=Acinetobacter seifertii TaxID=1530123 RepID=N8S7U3_9GAMM|nr:hypothetical protein F985_01536 [Acinetobacter seifertii]